MANLNKDVLFLVFEDLIDDKKSLHSSLLVNRIWCEIAVPILWKDPWRNLRKKRSLLEVIVSFLTNETRESMMSRGLNLLIKPDKQPLFNYIRYCRNLDLSKLEEVIYTIRNIREESKWSIIRYEIFKLFINEDNKFIKLIIPSGFRHQIQLLPGFENCFSKLESLQCVVGSGEGITYRLAEMCKSIKDLVIGAGTGLSYDLKGIIRIIEAQPKLENVRFLYYGFDYGFNYYSINSVSSYYFYLSFGEALNKHVNTIQHLQVYIAPGLALSSFVNLKSLEINSCGYEGSWAEFEKVSLPSLQILIAHVVPSRSLSRFIENNKGILVKIMIHNIICDGRLMRAIYQNCPNLKYLGLKLNNYDWLELENLLTNCKYLNGLIMDISSTASCSRLFEILIKTNSKNLFKFKLIHQHSIDISHLRSFLSRWRDRHPMLLHFIYMNYISTKHLDLMEEYKIKGVVKNFYHDKNNIINNFEWVDY